MKKFLLTLLALGTIATYSHAEMKCGAGKCGASMQKSAHKPKKMMMKFQAVPAGKATLLQEGKAKKYCPECGMTLPMFYKTNHAATVEGKTKQYCSIHCLVEDMASGSKLTDIKVVDVTSLKFVDATKASYVVGSKKKGTMTMVSKYAFASKADAQIFAKANGGKVVDFKSALKAAEGDSDKDSKMISEKQDFMKNIGKVIYTKKCQKTDKKFANTAEAKAFVLENNLCEPLNSGQLQALGLYLGNK